MQGAAKDIAEILSLESSLSLTLATDLFYGRMPPSPDDAVCVYDAPGAGPMLTLSPQASPYRYGAVTIYVRNTDYDTGYNQAQDVLVYLHGVHQRIINDVKYTMIKARDDVHPLPKDENDRHVFAINFDVHRIPFTSTIAGLSPYVWIKASIEANITEDSNTDVTQVDSKSPGTYSLSDENNIPYHNDDNNTIDFDDANNEYLINNTMASDKFNGTEVPQSFTVVVTVNHTSSTGTILSWGTTGGFQEQCTLQVLSASNDGEMRLFLRDRVGRITTLSLLATTDDGGTYIIAVTLDGQFANAWVNGSRVVTDQEYLHDFDSEAEMQFTRFHVGKQANSSYTITYGNFSLKELAAFDSELPVGKVININNELNQEYEVY